MKSRRKTPVLCAVLLLTAALLTLPALAAELGSALQRVGGAQDSLCRESAIGDLAADAAAFALDAELAVIHGGAIAADLPMGAVDEARVQAVFTDDCALVLAELDEAQLAALLEQGVSRLVTDEAERIDGDASANALYPQVSGLSFTCDAAAPPGQRIVEVSADAAPANGLYRAALTQSLADSLGLLYEDAGMDCREALTLYIAACVDIETPRADRQTILGTSENTLISKVPLTAILIIAAASVLAKVVFGPRGRLRDYPDILEKTK